MSIISKISSASSLYECYHIDGVPDNIILDYVDRYELAAYITRGDLLPEFKDMSYTEIAEKLVGSKVMGMTVIAGEKTVRPLEVQ